MLNILKTILKNYFKVSQIYFQPTKLLISFQFLAGQLRIYHNLRFWVFNSGVDFINLVLKVGRIQLGNWRSAPHENWLQVGLGNKQKPLSWVFFLWGNQLKFGRIQLIKCPLFKRLTLLLFEFLKKWLQDALKYLVCLCFQQMESTRNTKKLP